MKIQTCPSAETLRDFLVGALSGAAAEDLDEHFANCSHCLATAEAMNLRDRLVETLAAPPLDFESIDAPALQALTQCVTKRVNAEDTAHLSRTEVGSFAFSTADDYSACVAMLQKPKSMDDIAAFGKYRVLQFLGDGGSGLVFQAIDTQLNRSVAIKFLRPSCVVNEKHRERFLRGARAMASVSHDHVVGIHEVGSHGDLPYVVMPHLQGESLQTRLDREDRLPPQAAIQIVRQVSLGLSAVHQAGLVHRDIKPDNIWLQSPSDHVQIVDFGIALDPSSDAEITSHTEMLGTPRYMSPEQVVSHDVDPRSDLFSLGNVLYRMLTGRPAFVGTNSFECMVSVTSDSVLPPHLYDRTIPQPLSRIVKRLLEKRPQDRFQSAQQLLAALERLDNTQPPRKFAGKFVALTLLAVVLLTVITLKFKDREGNETVIRIDNEKIASVDIGLAEAATVSPKLHVVQPSTSTPHWSEDEIVDWIRKQAGSVVVYVGEGPSGEIRRVPASESLPTDAWRVLGVESEGQVVDQDYLDRVEQLKYLVSLKIDVNQHFTKQHLEFIASMEKLTLLHVNLQRSDRSPITDAGIQYLTALKKLETLRINAPQLTDESIQYVSQIQRLSFFGNEIPLVTDKGLQHLDALPELRYLHLIDARQISGAGIRFLRNQPQLEELVLKDSQLQAADLEPLAQLTKISVLCVTNCNLDDTSIPHIADWQNLRILSLEGTKVTDRGIQQLTSFDTLKELKLASTPITDAAVDTLVRFEKLRVLDVRDSDITPDGIARLRSELPTCRVLQ